MGEAEQAEADGAEARRIGTDRAGSGEPTGSLVLGGPGEAGGGRRGFDRASRSLGQREPRSRGTLAMASSGASAGLQQGLQGARAHGNRPDSRPGRRGGAREAGSDAGR